MYVMKDVQGIFITKHKLPEVHRLPEAHIRFSDAVVAAFILYLH
jgi:hypothetical protein